MKESGKKGERERDGGDEGKGKRGRRELTCTSGTCGYTVNIEFDVNVCRP